jgi:hypothetical protein
MTITATLLFPFGDSADYGVLPRDLQLERYGVYINGEKIKANIRHTDILDYYHFDTNAHVATLHDEFVEDDFYSPDLTVTKYSYEIVGHSNPRAEFVVNIDPVGSERMIVIYESNMGGYITKSGGFCASSSPKKNETKVVCFYVFGEPLTALPDAGWYRTNGMNPDTKTDG